MLLIWSKHSAHKVLSALSPVLRHTPDLPVSVVADTSVLPDTKVILALGADGVAKLQAAKVVPKGRSITSLRTRPHNYFGTPALVSYSSDIGDVEYAYYVDLLMDTGSAVRLHETGSIKPQLGQYRWVEDFTDVVQHVQERYQATGRPVDLTLDLEWVGETPYILPHLDPKTKVPHPGSHIVTIQLTHTKGFSDCVRFPSRDVEMEQLGKESLLRNQLQWLLTSPEVKLRGANLKGDLEWITVRAGIWCTNFTFDTTIVGSLLDENRSNALDVHTKIYVPALGGYSDEFDAQKGIKKRMDLVPPDKLLPYAGGDTDACHQVADAEKAELLKDPALTGFYVNILHPASRAFERIERGGVLVDKERFKELDADLTAEMLSCVKEAKDHILGGRIVYKHMDSTKLGGMNLKKASMLVDYMFTPMGLNLKPRMWTPKEDKDGHPKPSTAIDHLLMFQDVPEAQAFLQVYSRYAAAEKVKSTYVDGFLEWLCPDDRFHPWYFLYAGNKKGNEEEGGTVTGRLSAKKPAFQTLPKHHPWAKRIRRCYIAPPGYVIAERDYSQGELRVVACIAYEDNMIAAYRAGRDLHSETAGPFKGFSYEQMMEMKRSVDKLMQHQFKEIRQLGKAGNFGLVYGMSASGFQIYARDNYGVALTEAEAKDFRDKFFARYPNLLVYHQVYKDFAHKHGFVRHPLGRIRHLPLINSPVRETMAKEERRAINSPVQGCLSDMMLWTLGLEGVQEDIVQDAPCFGVCHDAAYNYIREDKVDLLLPRMLQGMENLPFERVGWQPQLQFLADASVGYDMGEMKDYQRPKGAVA